MYNNYDPSLKNKAPNIGNQFMFKFHEFVVQFIN